jgi:hypothetical protein
MPAEIAAALDNEVAKQKTQVMMAVRLFRQLTGGSRAK